MKITFKDFGRCLICLNNPCKCKINPMETSSQDDLRQEQQRDIEEQNKRENDE